MSLTDVRDLRGKTVFVRVDLNSPTDPKTGKVDLNPRFTAHAETVKLLAQKGAKVVVLAHQGRKGDEDCISLGGHARILSKLIGKKVLFKTDAKVVSPATIKAIRGLKPGQVMLLDNVRFLDDEAVQRTAQEHANSELVRALAPLAQVFVQDAWSNAHRAHASMVGFATLVPSYAGPVFERELAAAQKASGHADHPVTYVLGGSKPEDVIKLMQYSLENMVVDKILTSGVIGEMCLIARGNQLPAAKMEELKAAGFMHQLLALRDLIHLHNDKIETPFDFAYIDESGKRCEFLLTSLAGSPNPVYDIGTKTARKYAKACNNSKTVFMKGPCGKYEQEAFQHGTKTVLEAIANCKAYTLIGGGHTLTALEKFNIPKEKISFISLAGGALLEFLQGNTLPAVAALELSAKKFGKKA